MCILCETLTRQERETLETGTDEEVRQLLERLVTEAGPEGRRDYAEHIVELLVTEHGGSAFPPALEPEVRAALARRGLYLPTIDEDES